MEALVPALITAVGIATLAAFELLGLPFGADFATDRR